MRNPFSYLVGGLLIVLGGIFLLDNFGYLDADWAFENLWPLLLVLGGVILISRRRGRLDHSHTGNKIEPTVSPGSFDQARMGDHVNESEFLGSIRRQLTSKNFTGGRCSVVFGDIMLDMTQIELVTGEQVLRLSSIFGAIRVELPRDLEYSMKANLVVGGLNVKGDRRGGVFQNVAVRSNSFAIADKRLAIFASSVFGDIKIV